MGRLAGFTREEVIRRIGKFGFRFGRRGGGHDIYINPATQQSTPIPRHKGDIKEGTLRGILRQAGIEPDDFLEA